MKKVILLSLLCLLFLSCSSDDSGLDPALKLDSYVEPYLNFLINEETFVAVNGPADERKDPAGSGFVLAYNRDLNGVQEYSYGFTRNNTTFIEGLFTSINVRLEPNSHNRNLVRNALTNIYGEPDLFVDEGTNVLIFPPTSNYEVDLLFNDGENPRLIVIYDGLN